MNRPPPPRQEWFGPDLLSQRHRVTFDSKRLSVFCNKLSANRFFGLVYLNFRMVFLWYVFKNNRYLKNFF